MTANLCTRCGHQKPTHRRDGDACVACDCLGFEPCTVFVVQDDCCGGCGNVWAVCSTREAAQAYIKREQPGTSHNLSIQDYELDLEQQP